MQKKNGKKRKGNKRWKTQVKTTEVKKNEEPEVEVFQGLEIKGDKIFGYDSHFSGWRWVAMIDHEKKIVKPTHGYYLPHAYGKKAQKYALKLGYEFKEK